jgi:hypothetical protein
MGKIVARLGTILALVFIGIVLVRGAADLPAVDWRSGRLWLGLSGALALYLMAQLIGAFAWNAVLRIYATALPLGRAESQLLLSQIGKYIPGNVAHLFGRLSLARADGVTGTTAGAAMLLEVGALLTTGFVIVGLIVLLDPELMLKLITGLPDITATTMIAVSFAGVFACLIAGQIIIWRRAGRPAPSLLQCMLPIALHTANFVLLGISLWCVTTAIVPDNVPILHCIAIFTTAWILGFLTPGAPGGVGIRDGIIALGLELFIGQGAGLGVAVAHRLISVVGDVATFGIGLVLRRQSR